MSRKLIPCKMIPGKPTLLYPFAFKVRMKVFGTTHPAKKFIFIVWVGLRTKFIQIYVH